MLLQWIEKSPVIYGCLSLLAITAGSCAGSDAEESPDQGVEIITVLGRVPADSMGMTLIHEHVFLDWSGADSIDPGSWDEGEAYQTIMPYLLDMKERGVETFLECTPEFLGRNPLLLKKLSEDSGLRILTNTGYYAARGNQHIPKDVFPLSATALAQRWIREFKEGIAETGVLPGFIKIGMDSKPELEEIDRKLIRAAALTHLETGLTIVSHTGDDTTAAQQLTILQEAGVAPEAFVWTHAQRGTPDGHVRMGRLGAWISLDGMGWIEPDAASRDSTFLLHYLNLLVNLKKKDLLDKTLISHDAGWYTVGAPDQEGYKPYTAIFDLVIPSLKDRGFTEADFEQILVMNPREAYGIRVRPTGANHKSVPPLAKKRS